MGPVLVPLHSRTEGGTRDISRGSFAPKRASYSGLRGFCLFCIPSIDLVTKSPLFVHSSAKGSLARKGNLKFVERGFLGIQWCFWVELRFSAFEVNCNLMVP